MSYIPLIIALIGLLFYLLSDNAKASETGRIMFFSGLLVTLMKMGESTMRLF